MMRPILYQLGKHEGVNIMLLGYFSSFSPVDLVCVQYTMANFKYIKIQEEKFYNSEKNLKFEKFAFQ